MDNCQLFLKLKEKRSARVKNFCKTRFICKKQRAYALCFLVGGYYGISTDTIVTTSGVFSPIYPSEKYML